MGATRYPGPISIDSRSGYRWIVGLTIDRYSDRLSIDIGVGYRSISDPDISLIFKGNKVKQRPALAMLLSRNASCHFEANPLSSREKREIPLDSNERPCTRRVGALPSDIDRRLDKRKRIHPLSTRTVRAGMYNGSGTHPFLTARAGTRREASRESCPGLPIRSPPTSTH
uniref:Uncharacterized protein n=1 Tax=Candidatus Kentrum sp. MB TaxID=2138164 RepID=A0A450XAZ9_9GAMM|nr:MAG: hypothetical protein BECKMB1821G_GA0114241_102114 [Candidatus Kentron sp. MB]